MAEKKDELDGPLHEFELGADITVKAVNRAVAAKMIRDMCVAYNLDCTQVYEVESGDIL